MRSLGRAWLAVWVVRVPFQDREAIPCSSRSPAAAIRDVFDACRDRLRLVVLNACLTSELAAAITQYVDCVVGMSTEVGDLDARVFAEEFYGALGYGRNVATAFKQAKVAVRLRNLPDHAVPQLLHRPGVQPDQISFAPTRSYVGRMGLMRMLVAVALMLAWVVILPRRDFAQTVFVHGPGGRQDLVLRGTGKLWLDLGREREEAFIDERGAAYFPSIAAVFRGRGVPVLLQADWWRLRDTQAVCILNGEAAYLALEPLEAVITGTVLRPGGVKGLAGVRVSIGAHRAISDEQGRFRILLPAGEVEGELDLVASLPGHRDHRSSVRPRGGPIKFILEPLPGP